MVVTLQHNPSPQTSNFYESSFRQLSDIQQKQTGLLIGAAVGDAAARPLEGHSAEEISRFIKEASNLYKESELEDILVFAPTRKTNQSSGALNYHSYTYLLSEQLLRVMAAARGEFPLNNIKNDWVASAAAHPNEFISEHASLLHVLGITLQLPIIYPWASDDTLREYAKPFIQFLTEPPPVSESQLSSSSSLIDNNNNNDNKEKEKKQLQDETRAAVEAYTFAVLGVALRCLQSNPNPYKNAAFLAPVGTSDIFPDDIALLPNMHNSIEPTFTSKISQRTALFLDDKRTNNNNNIKNNIDASLLLFPVRSVVHDVNIVREGIIVARSSRTFADGIRTSIKLGGPVSQRSLIVGAILGARLGVRRIPMHWLSATYNYSPLVTRALEIAQWSWNPPHH